MKVITHINVLSRLIGTSLRNPLLAIPQPLAKLLVRIILKHLVYQIMISSKTEKNSRYSFFRNPKAAFVLFVVSFIVFLYYFVGYVIPDDVYKFPVVGAIYEMLWLPMFLSLVVIPIVGILILMNRNNRKWFALISLILIAAVIFILSKF